MTSPKIQAATSLLALACLSAIAQAQISSGGGGATSSEIAPGPDRSVCRIVVLKPGIPSDWIAFAVGAELVGSLGGPNSPGSPFGTTEFAMFEFPTLGAALAAETVLDLSPDVILVEPPVNLTPPEICGVPSGVATQQCTVAFFDATPTTAEYTDQVAGPAIGLDETTAVNGNKKGTRVAVIDTGVDFNHPLLVGRFLQTGYDFVLDQPHAADIPNAVDDDGDGLVDEAYGHGTFIAGLIALVDPQVEIMPYRILNSDGIGTSWDLASAIDRAASDGAQIINLSLSLAGPSEAVELAIQSAASSINFDLTFVGAAGNAGEIGVNYPAAYEGVLGVAALDELGTKADFSNYGPEVDICAPGVDVYSAMPGFAYATWSGTSMSTALATGAISRLATWKKNFSPTECAQAIRLSGEDASDMNPGFDGWLGSGQINIADAAALLADGDSDNDGVGSDG